MDATAPQPAEPQWLIREVAPLDAEALDEIARELPDERLGTFKGAQDVPFLAVRLKEVTIHDTRKWFGGADVRIDALVVHGHGQPGAAESFYAPQTFRFPNVRDGDRLPIDPTGMLVYYGRPLHFLDLFITASRDRKDSDDLATLLKEQLGSQELQAAFGTLLGLAVAAPQVAVVTAAIGAAALVGNFAYQVVRQATGATIGLYRGSFLQHRDGFGIGTHPDQGARRDQDLSLQYEIVLDEAPG
jgi:hypothetical protein